MLTQTHVKKRQFDLTKITEEEGLVLRTLVNLSDEGIRKSLLGDHNYWNDQMSLDEATATGIQLRKQIFEMMDPE
jgi:hypothetical protein